MAWLMLVQQNKSALSATEPAARLEAYNSIKYGEEQL
jgi:hypothetical protein